MSLPESSVGRNSGPFQSSLPDKENLWQQTYLEAFQKNYEAVQRWTRWKEDHERVKSNLATLPDKILHDVVVPFGSKALMKAKLVHTNEVLTCIGSSWFVKQSAKQGIEMCERRINQSEEMISKLEKERILLSNRQNLPKVEEAFASEDTKEIVEAYDEEVEAEWRRQHREREALYRQKLAELRKKQIDQPPMQSEEDIFRRLDELELEEELNDELERLHAEYEADCENDDEEEGESSGNETSSEDSEDAELSRPSISSLKHEVSNSVLEEVTSSSASKTASLLNRESSRERDQEVIFEASRKNRRISFADETQEFPCTSKDNVELDENIYIRFHHSQESLLQKPSEKLASVSAEGGTELSVYHNPADIYNVYKERLNSSPPKSILKKSSSYPEKLQDFELKKPMQSSASFGSSLGFTFADSETDDGDLQPVRDISHLPTVLCDVQEKSGTLPMLHSSSSAKESTQRPVSRFKQARQGSKKH